MTSPSPHACASCGRRCRACEDGKACTRATWCRWCSGVYAENAPADDGRVYCAGCGAPFPSLAVLIERGLSKYPRYCKSCREERREAAAAARELNARVGAESVVAGKGDGPKRTDPPRKHRTPKLPAGPPPAHREEQERGLHAASGTRSMSTGEQVAAASREQAEREPDAHAVRGGFVPRPTPGQREFPDHSEMANGKTDWPGTRVSALYHGE